jgi:hypothetical protein
MARERLTHPQECFVCTRQIQEGTEARHMVGRCHDTEGNPLELHYYVHPKCDRSKSDKSGIDK